MPPAPNASIEEHQGFESQVRSSPARARTVNEFNNVHSLRSALRNCSQRGVTSFVQCMEWGTSCNYDNTEFQADYTKELNGQEEPFSDLDWVTENLDMNICRAQSVEEEMDRLLVLKSYMILDSDQDKHFERLTGIASRVFDVPISLVSLVDIGRQWFMSNRGLGDVRETPRKMAFCSHAIQSGDDFLIVPDATRDSRFEQNPLVTGPPHIRFYAGAPLLTSNGYRLGTLCIIDRKPRPGGLTIYEKQTLSELAAMVMEEMERRKEERMQLTHGETRVLACQAHDLMTPLSGAERAISQLEDLDAVSQSEARLSGRREKLIKDASTCLNTIRGICLAAISDEVTEEPREPIVHKSDFDIDSYKRVENDGLCKKDNSQELAKLAKPGSSDVCQVRLLAQKLRSIMSTYPKSVPLSITVDPKVPEVIVCDELKIFRSAMNYLTNALDRTKTGSVELRVNLKELKTREGCRTEAALVFECEDTGPGVNSDTYGELFRPTGTAHDHSKPAASKSGLGLFSVASNISSLGGKYGFYARDAEGDPMVTKKIGAVFWFSVPLVVPYSTKIVQPENGETLRSGTEQRMGKASNETHRVKMLSVSNMGDSDSKQVYDVVSFSMQSGGKDHENISTGCASLSVQKQALVIDDSLVIRKSISRALQRLGFYVKLATNGMEGLKMLQSSKYDVVFCDVLMPYMDGLECVKQYRAWEDEHRPSFRQHIIGLSAHDSEDVVKEGMIAGMNDFVPKSKKLSEALSKALAVAELPDDDDFQAEERTTSRRKIRWRDITNVPLDSSLASLGLHTPHPSLSPAKRAAFCAGLSSPLCSGGSHPKVSVSHGGFCGGDRVISSLARSVLTGDAVIAPVCPKRNIPAYECLIAADSLSVLKLLIKVVQEKGWKAKVANDGEEALRLLKTRKWDAVFIDEDVPSISGTNCMTRLRVWETEQNRTEHQKNVFLIDAALSLQQKQTFTAVQSSRFDGRFGKPVCLKDIVSALNSAAQNMHQEGRP